jgi:hypothetical protein
VRGALGQHEDAPGGPARERVGDAREIPPQARGVPARQEGRQPREPAVPHRVLPDRCPLQLERVRRARHPRGRGAARPDRLDAPLDMPVGGDAELMEAEQHGHPVLLARG